MATKKEKDKTVDEPSEPTPEARMKLLVAWLDGQPSPEYPTLLEADGIWDRIWALCHLIQTGQPVDAHKKDGLPGERTLECHCRICLAA